MTVKEFKQVARSEIARMTMERTMSSKPKYEQSKRALLKIIKLARDGNEYAEIVLKVIGARP